MQSVRFLPDILDTERTILDRWYVTDGANAVGPIDFEHLAGDIITGKIPLHCFVRNEGWRIWRRIADIARFDDKEVAEVAPRSSRVPRSPAPSPSDREQQAL